TGNNILILIALDFDAERNFHVHELIFRVIIFTFVVVSMLNIPLLNLCFCNWPCPDVSPETA
ncbi:hypothetical protein L9F63_007533, partial [Diploptera punctata]